MYLPHCTSGLRLVFAPLCFRQLFNHLQVRDLDKAAKDLSGDISEYREAAEAAEARADEEKRCERFTLFLT